MRHTLPLTLSIAALIAFSGCGDTDGDTTDSAGDTMPADVIARGQASYDKYCALCHGDMGQGYASPAANALSNPDFLAAATDDFLKEAILYGRTGTKMSAFGEDNLGPLNNEEADELVAFLRSQATLPVAEVHDLVVSGDIANGEAIYGVNCASCHGPQGEGTTIALSLNNPIFLRSASDGFIRHALTEGRRGTAMVSYDGILTDKELDDLVALIRSWQP